MDKKYIPLDGEQMEVFYLGKSPPPNAEVDSMKILHVENSSQECPSCDTPIPFGITTKGVSGCCPVGPKGNVGPTGIDPLLIGQDLALDDPPAFNVPKGFFKKIMAEIKKGERSEIKLDDTIPSDTVNEPMAGRIYRVKGLNKLARFVAMADENLFYMQYNDAHPFYLNRDDEMLLKATSLEVQEYIDGLQI